MTNFYYYGKKTTGEAASGQVEARTKEEAVDLISRQGILPVSVDERTKSSISNFGAKLKGSIRFHHCHMFTYQIANLLKSGVPLLRAIEILRNQSTNERFSSLLETIQQDIKNGKSFSDCLTNHPAVFSSLYIAMVRAGEESGNLFQVLRSLADHQKAQKEIAAKVKAALIYPFFMAAVGVGTIIFILTAVMPKISILFLSVGQELPLLTRILITVSNFLVAGWFILVPAVALTLFLIIRWNQSVSGRQIMDRLKLKLPIIGNLIQKVELARFYRTLELLLVSGLSLLRGLKVTLPIIGNREICQDLSKSKDFLQAGESLSQSFEQCRFISPLIVQLIRVGEESGLLEDTLKDIAESYEQEVNETIKNFTTILEPLMILLIGIIVGFVVMAMLLPIFQMDVLSG